jgi:hypothetical protein
MKWRNWIIDHLLIPNIVHSHRRVHSKPGTKDNFCTIPYRFSLTFTHKQIHIHNGKTISRRYESQEGETFLTWASDVYKSPLKICMNRGVWNCKDPETSSWYPKHYETKVLGWLHQWIGRDLYIHAMRMLLEDPLLYLRRMNCEGHGEGVMMLMRAYKAHSRSD